MNVFALLFVFACGVSVGVLLGRRAAAGRARPGAAAPVPVAEALGDAPADAAAGPVPLEPAVAAALAQPDVPAPRPTDPALADAERRVLDRLRSQAPRREAE